jgi:hypothetical protein
MDREDIMKISVDFDGTLMDERKVPGYKMGKPFPLAKEAMEELKKMGYEIIIFSAKDLSASGEKAIKDWMRYFKIPFDRVTSVKTHSDFYVDDRAVPFNGDWREVISHIKNVGAKNGK